MLQARVSLRAEYGKLHRMLLGIVRAEPICRRLMTVPGVGPVVPETTRRRSTIRQDFANPKMSVVFWANTNKISPARCDGAHRLV
jgi:hypothetical protein